MENRLNPITVAALVGRMITLEYPEFNYVGDVLVTELERELAKYLFAVMVRMFNSARKELEGLVERQQQMAFLARLISIVENEYPKSSKTEPGIKTELEPENIANNMVDSTNPNWVTVCDSPSVLSNAEKRTNLLTNIPSHPAHIRANTKSHKNNLNDLHGLSSERALQNPTDFATSKPTDRIINETKLPDEFTSFDLLMDIMNSERPRSPNSDAAIKLESIVVEVEPESIINTIEYENPPYSSDDEEASLLSDSENKSVSNLITEERLSQVNHLIPAVSKNTGGSNCINFEEELPKSDSSCSSISLPAPALRKNAEIQVYNVVNNHTATNSTAISKNRWKETTPDLNFFHSQSLPHSPVINQQATFAGAADKCDINKSCPEEEYLSSGIVNNDEIISFCDKHKPGAPKPKISKTVFNDTQREDPPEIICLDDSDDDVGADIAPSSSSITTQNIETTGSPALHKRKSSISSDSDSEITESAKKARLYSKQDAEIADRVQNCKANALAVEKFVFDEFARTRKQGRKVFKTDILRWASLRAATYTDFYYKIRTEWVEYFLEKFNIELSANMGLVFAEELPVNF